MIMEMKHRSALCDYFVVMSATSTVRVKAIVDHVRDVMHKASFRAVHTEGYHDARWVLLDFGDVITHVFHHETRKYYDLENLWGDMRKRNYHGRKP